MTKAGFGILSPFVSLVVLAVSAQVSAATAEQATFGKMPDGETVQSVTLTGDNGVSVVLITLGATIQAFNVPDRNGYLADITVGYDNVADYFDAPNYWGQTIGRYANRIAKGRFAIDGRPYQVTLNNAQLETRFGF